MRFGPNFLTAPAMLVLAATVGCAVTRRDAPEDASRHRSADVDPRYVRPGPIPSAALARRSRSPRVEVYDVTLPSKASPGAPPEARAPIGMRWWRPRAPDLRPTRHPAVVLSPILGSRSAFVESFAERFAREGWHAVVVFRPEVAYDPSRPFSQVEERIADAVTRRVEVLDWLLTRDDVDPSRLASFGISAGGIEASLVAGADPRYVAHVIGLAGGPLADVFVESDEDRIRRVTATARAAVGDTEAGFADRLRRTILTDPIRLAPRVPTDSVLLILARHDRAVPTHTGEALRSALGRPRTIFLPLGHYASVLFLPFVKPRVVDFLAARFEAARNETGRSPTDTVGSAVRRPHR